MFFKQISVSFITPNSGAEIKEEISDIGSAIIEISLTFNSGYYVNSIKLGTQDAISLKSLTGTISGGEYCTAVRYTANESGSEVLIEVINLKADLPITLGFTSTAQNLKESGLGVSTIAITSTIGGSVTLIGDDFENLADTDTITCVAKVCVQGYEFVGWYKSSDMDTAISTNASVRFSKADIYGEEIIAVFRQINNTSVNDQTSN